MSTSGFLNSFNLRLEQPIKKHLQNVYAALSMCVLSSAAGSYVNFILPQIFAGSGFIFSLLSAGLALNLFFNRDNGKNRLSRLMMLLAFAFLAGLGMGPLISMSVRINPEILPTAFLLSSVVFASFSGAALYAPDGKYLYLGGTLISGLSYLFVMGLLNIFFQSYLMFQAYLWIGLFLHCGFIVWDTQMIIEKRRLGDHDYIAHALDLFIDFAKVFKNILIILMQKDDSRSKKQRKN